MDATNDDGPPDSVAEALRALRRVLFEYPLAAQAGFEALVREGRSFAETAEGQAWRERLAGSDAVAKGRVVWEVLTQSAFTEDAEGPMPGVILEAFSRATAVSMLEPFLSMLFEEG
jgi:hypothetical protein